jgi:hypothetical protein
MSPPKVSAPAEVLADQGRGEWKEKLCTDESTPTEPKRKLGSVWREGRCLCRKGPNGNTIFNTWEEGRMRAAEPEMAHDSGTASTPFQSTDTKQEFRYKSGISGTRPLRCERVNDITFKITDGEMSRVPAKQGWWGGYNAPRALAWVSNVGINSSAWIARCDDKVSGPFSFNEAKAKAIILAKGAEGDYRIQNPISHLNGLQARLLDQEGKL